MLMCCLQQMKATHQQVQYATANPISYNSGHRKFQLQVKLKKKKKEERK